MPSGALVGDSFPIPAPRLLADHSMTYNASGGATVTVGPLADSTQMIQIALPASNTGTGIRWALTSNAAGTTPLYLVPMGAVVYYRAYPGEYFSVVSDDANGGYLDMAECASRRLL